MRIFAQKLALAQLPFLGLGFFLAASCSCADTKADTAEISFNRDVRPILAAKCFACHGPDDEHREAGLRLDAAEDAHQHGVFEFATDEPSLFVERIESGDEDEVMPPPHANKPLTDDEKRILKKWVAAGAQYETHWAFIGPLKPSTPSVKQKAWPQNEIDAFILANLEANDLRPSETADRYTLVRRLYLDLIGLPPTPAQADDFANSPDPDAYQKLVDSLLASPRYGEHWAAPWLDLARYADTNGYEKDRPRSIWPYRDWVIKSLNADMPYDQFSVEQLAGDMLPDATESQLLATGFHRNTMLNEEGGIDPNEYRFQAMIDRVATTGTVWMGLTTGCAQCHTHKYDPITHTDFFGIYALLNNADEVDLTIEQTHDNREETIAKIEQLENELPEKIAADIFDPAFASWLANQKSQAAIQWTTPVPIVMQAESVNLMRQDDGSIFAIGDPAKRDVYEIQYAAKDLPSPIAAIRIRALPDSRLPARGPGLTWYEGRKGDFFLSEFSAAVGAEPIAFKSTNSAAKVLDGNGSSGWKPGAKIGETSELVIVLDKPIAPESGLQLSLLFERHYAAGLGRFAVSFSDSSNAQAADPVLQLDLEDEAACRIAFAKITPLLSEARQPIDALHASLPKPPYSMVMSERESFPRETFRHHRGEWLSPREKVDPAIPEFLSGDGAGPANRLQFARWLVSRKNPLAARVAVNRAWRAFFGRGLVDTASDFGVQCDVATHPKLLDWLAVELMENGWSMKRLHKQIVSSAAYQQRSSRDEKSAALDPRNRWLGHMPRFRLSGETVRDSMLAASGLLADKMYGPGVFPPQPQSVTAMAYGGFRWNESSGEDRVRRSIYTFRKRTAPFAAYTVFDAPTGETCTARRNRSNTPLQALTLLNDKMYLEMAFALAKLAESKSVELKSLESTDDKIEFIFRRLLTRHPEPAELKSLRDYCEAQRRRFDTGELNAAEVTGSDAVDDVVAALTMTARVIMNLDEAMTRP